MLMLFVKRYFQNWQSRNWYLVNLALFMCNDEYIYIKQIYIAVILSKTQVVKIRKIEADSDSDGNENHTCSRLQSFNSTCLLHVNHLLLLKRNIYSCILCFWSSEVKYLCRCNMYFCQKKVASQQWQFDS